VNWLGLTLFSLATATAQPVATAGKDYWVRCVADGRHADLVLRVAGHRVWQFFNETLNEEMSVKVTPGSIVRSSSYHDPTDTDLNYRIDRRTGRFEERNSYWGPANVQQFVGRCVVIPDPRAAKTPKG
jgi:hypothetical protein